jgi:hypothetical protein
MSTTSSQTIINKKSYNNFSDFEITEKALFGVSSLLFGILIILIIIIIIILLNLDRLSTTYKDTYNGYLTILIIFSILSIIFNAITTARINSIYKSDDTDSASKDHVKKYLITVIMGIVVSALGIIGGVLGSQK